MKRPLLAAFALAVLPAAGPAPDTEWNRYARSDLGGVYMRH